MYRVLKPGGVLRIVVPDTAKAIAAYVQQDTRFLSQRLQTWRTWPMDCTMLEGFLHYSGAPRSPGGAISGHKYGYDYETLAKLLTQVGFGAVARSDYMKSSIADLRVDDRSAVAKASFALDQYYSLFVEATA